MQAIQIIIIVHFKKKLLFSIYNTQTPTMRLITAFMKSIFYKKKTMTMATMREAKRNQIESIKINGICARMPLRIASWLVVQQQLCAY